MGRNNQPDRYDMGDAFEISASSRAALAMANARSHIISGDQHPKAVAGFELLKDATDFGDRDRRLLEVLMRAASGEKVHTLAANLLREMTDHMGQHLAANDHEELAAELAGSGL